MKAETRKQATRYTASCGYSEQLYSLVQGRLYRSAAPCPVVTSFPHPTYQLPTHQKEKKNLTLCKPTFDDADAFNGGERGGY